MKVKQIWLIAVCCILWATIGCHRKPDVQSVLVSPEHGAFKYARTGDTLEFKALDPNEAPFYVIFIGKSPCKEKIYRVEKTIPARCTVQPGANFYRYGLSRSSIMQFDPENCFPCDGIYNGGSPGEGEGEGSPQAPPEAPPKEEPSEAPKASSLQRPTATSIADYSQPVTVSCDGKATKIDPDPVSKAYKGTIWWLNPANPTDLTIAFTEDVCQEGKVISGVNNCTLTGAPKPTPYAYTATTKSCGANLGNGSLTITASQSH